jgi:hypothetical protein
MMILCQIHGVTSALRCSWDLHPSAAAADRPREVVDLIYKIEGQAAWAYYVSPGFASRHGLAAGVYDDAEPGTWETELAGSCSKCFKRANGGHFDDAHRWRSGTSR